METPASAGYPGRSTKVLQIINIIGFLIMVIMNFLANWLPINGKNTGEISDQYPNLFVPSGATFSIWGIIYLLLLVFAIYQARTIFGSKSNPINELVDHIGIWYFLSCILNAFWILAWHYELLPVSVAIMWLLLLTLIITKFGIANYINQEMSGWNKFIIKAPFGFYLGWISVATIANMTAWLSATSWRGGLEEDTWAVIMIMVGGVFALYAAQRLSNGFLTLAVVWAFVRIVAKRINEQPMYYSIAFIAGLMALILFVFSIIILIRNFKKKKHSQVRSRQLYE